MREHYAQLQTLTEHGLHLLNKLFKNSMVLQSSTAWLMEWIGALLVLLKKTTCPFKKLTNNEFHRQMIFTFPEDKSG